METVNGGSLGDDKGGPPPPSPLTGCYLLIVIGEPHSGEHKDIILQKVAKGLLSWNVNDCLVDLEKELTVITEQGLEGEEARYGERLIQFASENLVTEILIHPAVNTLSQCVRNLLSSFTRHRHIIHAGYTFQGNGSWALQDGTFSYADFSEAFQEIEVQRVIRAYENGISIDLHCSPEGDWSRLPKESFTKACKVRVNPTDVLTTGSPSITNFIKYLSPFLIPSSLESILESSDVVGNIRFSRPTLYVFPGGQGDAALFGINGFNMLLDGGYSRKACFWDFVRHLDRLDAVLMSRLNNCSVSGISSVLKRKRDGAVYPQVGHFFCNLQERKSILSPDGDKDRDPLIINLLEEGQEIVSDLRHLNLNPQFCYRDSEPIILYHKVGHGTLNMYVLSPEKNSKDVRDFMQKWNQSDGKLFSTPRMGKEFVFPLPNLVSICALLVWQPANPNDTITRILYPGSTPQKKIFEGLDRLRSLEYIKHPVCSEKSLAPIKKTKHDVIEKMLIREKPQLPDKKIVDDGDINGDVIKEKQVVKSDSIDSAKKSDEGAKIMENGDKPKPKPKVPEVKSAKQRSESQQRKKPPADKKGPSTPKKTVDNKMNGENKEREKKLARKPSPSATPAKSTKDANNRKVIEAKKIPPKKDAAPKAPAPVEPKPKVERKPISRRPKTAKAPISPVKKLTNGVQKPDSLTKRGKLDKEGTTDSSTVSTPSADQESVLKKDLSKLTPEEIQQMKAQELAELKEEQDAIKEIEAVFRKGEEQPASVDIDSDLRKIKDISIEEKLEPEEYLIIEKEELEHDSLEIKEDEMQKLTRDSEESEKQRKFSAELKEIDIQEEKVEKEMKAEIETTKVVDVLSPEEKASTVEKKEVDDEVKEVIESHPEEKVSANVESGATTTAPTLPEDERITLDEIKEDNGQVIEEKHVKEETKEKEIPVIQLPPKSYDTLAKVPQVVGIRLDKQSHIRDIVKTPDEVADLPVHEEVDFQEYTGDSKKTNDVEAVKDNEVKIDKKQDEETKEAISPSDEIKEATGVEDKADLDKEKEETSDILEKAELETKEKTEKEVPESHIAKEILNETIDDEWVVITKETDDDKVDADKKTEEEKKISEVAVESTKKEESDEKLETLPEALKDQEIVEKKTEEVLTKTEDHDEIVSDFIAKDQELSTSVDQKIEISAVTVQKIEDLPVVDEIVSDKVREDTVLPEVEKDKQDASKIEILPEDEKIGEKEHDVQKSPLETQEKSIKEVSKDAQLTEDFVTKDIGELPTTEDIRRRESKTIEENMISIKETMHEMDKVDEKLQELKGIQEPVHDVKPVEGKQDVVEPKALDLKKEVEEVTKLDEKPELQIKTEISLSPEHAEQVTLPDSSPDEDDLKVLKELKDIDKAELGRKSPQEREEDVKKIVAGVAEVLKSEAPLEVFEAKLPLSSPTFTQELRETHITTQDSPILETKIIKTDDIPPIPEEPANLPEELVDVKKRDLIAESQELIAATSKVISDIKGKTLEKVDSEDSGTVHRMLVTASSEDGGEEIEICPPGTITFSRSSESSGRSSPEPSLKTSQKSSIVDTLSETLSTVKQIVSEKDSGIDETKSEDRDVSKDAEDKASSGKSTPSRDSPDLEVEQNKKTGIFASLKDTFDSAKQFVTGKVEAALDEVKEKKADIEQHMEKKTEDLKNAEEKVEKAIDKIDQKAQQGQEWLEKTTDQLSKEVEDIKTHVGETLEDTKADIEHDLEKKAEDLNVEEKVEQVTNKIDLQAKDLLEKTTQKVEDIKTHVDQIKDALDEAKDAKADIKHHLEKKVDLKSVEEKVTSKIDEQAGDLLEKSTQQVSKDVEDVKTHVGEIKNTFDKVEADIDHHFEKKAEDLKNIEETVEKATEEIIQQAHEGKEVLKKTTEQVSKDLEDIKTHVGEVKDGLDIKSDKLEQKAEDLKNVEEIVEKATDKIHQQAEERHDIKTNVGDSKEELKEDRKKIDETFEMEKGVEKLEDIIKHGVDDKAKLFGEAIEHIEEQIKESFEGKEKHLVSQVSEVKTDVETKVEESKEGLKEGFETDTESIKKESDGIAKKIDELEKLKEATTEVVKLDKKDDKLEEDVVQKADEAQSELPKPKEKSIDMKELTQEVAPKVDEEKPKEKVDDKTEKVESTKQEKASEEIVEKKELDKPKGSITDKTESKDLVQKVEDKASEVQHSVKEEANEKLASIEVEESIHKTESSVKDGKESISQQDQTVDIQKVVQDEILSGKASPVKSIEEIDRKHSLTSYSPSEKAQISSGKSTPESHVSEKDASLEEVEKRTSQLLEESKIEQKTEDRHSLEQHFTKESSSASGSPGRTTPTPLESHKGGADSHEKDSKKIETVSDGHLKDTEISDADQYILPKKVVEKEEKELEERALHIQESFEVVSNLGQSISFDKCHKDVKQTDDNVKEIVKEEINELQQGFYESLERPEKTKEEVIKDEMELKHEEADHKKEIGELQNGFIESIAEKDNEVHKKQDKDIIAKEEEELERQALQIQESFEAVTDLARSIEFDKCHPAEDIKIDKDVIVKEEKQVDDEVRRVEETFKLVSDMSKSVEFEKCKGPSDDQKEGKKEERDESVSDIPKSSHGGVIKADEILKEEIKELQEGFYESLEKDDKIDIKDKKSEPSQDEYQISKDVIEKEEKDSCKSKMPTKEEKSSPEAFKTDEIVKGFNEPLEKGGELDSKDKESVPSQEEHSVGKDVIEKDNKEKPVDLEKCKEEQRQEKTLDSVSDLLKSGQEDAIKADKIVMEEVKELQEGVFERTDKIDHDKKSDGQPEKPLDSEPSHGKKEDKIPREKASDLSKSNEEGAIKSDEIIKEEIKELQEGFYESLETEAKEKKLEASQDTYPISKEVIEKDEKDIEQKVLHLQESFETVSDLARKLSFEKCHKPDLNVDTGKGKESKDDEKQKEIKELQEGFIDSIAREEKIEKDETESGKTADLHTRTVKEGKLDDEKKIMKELEEQEKVSIEKSQEDLVDSIASDKPVIVDDNKALEEKLTKQVFEKESEPKQFDEKLDSPEKVCDLTAKDSDIKEIVDKVTAEVKMDYVYAELKGLKDKPTGVEKDEKESMEKSPSKSTLTVDRKSEPKKLSISDVEISIKTEVCPKEASQMFIESERLTDSAKTPKEDDLSTTAGSSSQLQVSGDTLSGKSTPDVECSGKSTPPTVPVSPVIRDSQLTDLKSPSKVDTGLSEHTETDEDDLSTKSQVAHSQSDLDDMDMKLDPMSMSFYGALPDEEVEDIPGTYLYEITKAKYTVTGSTTEECDIMTASFIGELPTDEGDDTKTESKKDSVDEWGKPLGLPAPSYLHEITKAKFTSGPAGIDIMTSSFIGELPTTSEDLMNTSVYFDGSSGSGDDPIASWGKPLGLPSPAPISNNDKGTPKKERKLPANVTAKNKLNDDRKRADSPSKMRNKKINHVYVDLTYVPHHGNHYYSYVDFFRRVRARYYVFSGLEPSRQVYDALLEAKQTWDDKELEVTIIPTYDTDILGYWVAENEELLSKYKIDLSPSASRCTINLQDHETSCSAYRLEF